MYPRWKTRPPLWIASPDHEGQRIITHQLQLASSGHPVAREPVVMFFNTLELDFTPRPDALRCEGREVKFISYLPTRLQEEPGPTAACQCASTITNNTTKKGWNLLRFKLVSTSTSCYYFHFFCLYSEEFADDLNDEEKSHPNTDAKAGEKHNLHGFDSQNLPHGPGQTGAAVAFLFISFSFSYGAGHIQLGIRDIPRHVWRNVTI